jgi:hypothetical protein
MAIKRRASSRRRDTLLIVDRLRVITARQVGYRDEHKALREVQRSLLPTVLPQIPGMTLAAP